MRKENLEIVRELSKWMLSFVVIMITAERLSLSLDVSQGSVIRLAGHHVSTRSWLLHLSAKFTYFIHLLYRKRVPPSPPRGHHEQTSDRRLHPGDQPIITPHALPDVQR